MFKSTIGALVLLTAVAGCTTQRLNLAEIKPAPQRYSTVVMGEISAAKPELESLTGFFRSSFIEQMTEEGIKVLTEAPEEPVQDSFVFSGELVEIDTGNAAARIIVGFGAGAQKLFGKFELHAPDGTLLTTWESREKYGGGAGIGGTAAIGLEEFSQKYGKHTA